MEVTYNVLSGQNMQRARVSTTEPRALLLTHIVREMMGHVVIKAARDAAKTHDRSVLANFAMQQVFYFLLFYYVNP